MIEIRNDPSGQKKFNLALDSWHKNQLSEYSIEELEDLAAVCPVRVQNNIRPAKELGQAIAEEIRRKESAQAATRADEAAQKRHVEALGKSNHALHLARLSLCVAALATVIAFCAWWLPRGSQTPGQQGAQPSQLPTSSLVPQMTNFQTTTNEPSPVTTDAVKATNVPLPSVTATNAQP